jgi:hypothetical protein
MTNDKRFEITGIDALSRDMFDAFERAAVAEKPKRRKRPAPAKPGPKPDHGDGLFPPISASLTETQATDPNDLSAISASLPSLAGMVEKPLLPEAYQKAMVAIEAACPNGVPVERWQRALADAGSFFALWGDTAERLGWTADDLFGLHPTAPLSRMDHMGLVWLLKGERVVLLTATEARLERGSAYYRRGVSLPHAKLLNPEMTR